MNKCIYTLALIVAVLAFQSCQTETNVTEKAAKIHNRVLTVDTHTDSPLNLMHSNFEMGEKHSYKETRTCLDFPRMKDGGLDAVFLAVFIGQRERTPEGNKQAREKAIKIFEKIHESIDKNIDKASLALEPNDAYEIEKQGKRAVYIGLENGYPIGDNIDNVDRFYELGARYITLCHTSNNDICDSSTDRDGEEHGGLSKFGEKVVKRMNKLGMIVDVSHISDKSFYDVVNISKAPVIASHSCARSLCDHPRNLSDEMLKALKKNDGVIQICFMSDYLKEIKQDPARDSAYQALREKYNGFKDLTEEERVKARKEWYAINKEYPKKLATVKDIADHIDHVVKTIGIDYVGIGTDFDGGGRVKDCQDVSQMQNVTEELVRRGYTQKEIEKIWGGNFMRVFREVQSISGNQS
jgi:membrane dipeptidase